jgi:predicted RNA-binding protein with TRAM domain
MLLVALLVTAAGTAPAATQLQVLLPGESPAPGTSSGKLGTPTAQTVGVPFTVTVRACDDNWNLDTGNTDVVSLSSSDASATLPPQAALASGEMTFSVTFNAAGSFNVSATDQSDPTIPVATSANATAYVLHGFEFARISQKNQYAGVPMAIDVWAVDPVGDVVSGFTGDIRLQEITSYGEGRIEPSIVTLTNGTWSGSVTMYRADETSINRGNVNIYALLDSDPTKNGTSDPFTVHPGSLARVQIVVPGQNPLPGSPSGLTGSPASQAVGQTFAVDVYATDQYWNPLPSADVVRITSSDPGASTPVSGALNNGFRQFTLSLGTIGTQTLTVTDQTNGSIQGMTSDGIHVTSSAADHFEMDPIASPLTAGQPVAVTIRATDVGGNTITDYDGDAVLTANTGPGSISPEAIVFSSGEWTGNMVFRGAGGAVSFNCSDFSSPPHIGTSNSFEVLPGPYAGLQVLLPGQTPQGGTADGVEGTPNDQNAGSTFNLTIRAVDEFWNRVPGINNNVSLSSTDPFAGLPSDTTLSNGELTFPATLYKAGIQTITAADIDSSGIDSHTSAPVNVLPGPYARIVLIAPGEEVAAGTAEGRTGTATDQSINFAFTVTVYATDSWWNPVGGVTDVIRITSGDPLAELPPDTPMTDGRVDMSVRLSTGGFQQITASNVTQPAMPVSTTQVRAISSGFHLEAEVSPTSVQAGEPFNLTVKVTNDAGSVIQEINSTVTVTVQNASTQDPGLGTLLTTQFQLLQGQRTVAETYTYAEAIVLTITDDAGNDPAVTEVITVSPGFPAELRLSSSPSWVGGNKHASIRADVVDAYDNGVPDQPVVFSLIEGLGTLTSVDSLTSADGRALADFLSPREPGVSRIHAVAGALTADYDIETALVDPNTPGGTITNYPNPFHPGEAPTTIAYKLDDNARVTLKVYSLMGTLVLEKVFDEGAPGGTVGLNEFAWNGRNGDGNVVASGGYIVVVEAVRNGETINNMRRKVGVVR